MLGFCVRLGKNFAFEATFLHPVRSFRDGVTNKLDINVDLYEGDHNPKAGIDLTILNLTVFEFRVFNVNHANGEVHLSRERLQAIIDELKEKFPAFSFQIGVSGSIEGPNSIIFTAIEGNPSQRALWLYVRDKVYEDCLDKKEAMPGVFFRENK